MNTLLSKKSGRTLVTTGSARATVRPRGGPRIFSRQTVADGNRNAVDIVFVIDTTGSMDDKIEALLETCQDFVIQTGSLGLDGQFALIAFGDISIQGGGDTIKEVVSLTHEAGRITAGLGNIPRNNGFGNLGESSLEALERAMRVRLRPHAVKVIVLITDEPALEHARSATSVTKTLIQREFVAFVLSPDIGYFRAMALQTGGVWKLIGPDTDLSELLAMFRDMAGGVAQVAHDVHALGGGSVKEYLKLRPADDS